VSLRTVETSVKHCPSPPLPMKTLAIDSSLPAGSVAALSEGRVAQQLLPEANAHARRIAAALTEVAGSLGWTPGEAELIGVVRGPGSFTGLRVGIATAKALAWTTGATLIGVCGFEVIARQCLMFANPNASETRSKNPTVPLHPISIVYDAGRGELFTAEAVPAESATGWRVGPESLCTVEGWLATLSHGSHISGPALHALGDRLAADPLARRLDLVIAPQQAWLPTASEVGAIAILLASAGEAHNPHTLAPDYLRPTYAHENNSRSSP